MSELVRTSQKSLKSSSSSLAVTVGTASCQYTRLRCDAALIAHASARKASRFASGSLSLEHWLGKNGGDGLFDLKGSISDTLKTLRIRYQSNFC